MKNSGTGGSGTIEPPALTTAWRAPLATTTEPATTATFQRLSGNCRRPLTDC